MALVCIPLTEMVCLPIRQSREADVSPRVLAVLQLSSFDGENTFLSEQSLAVLLQHPLRQSHVADVSPRMLAVLPSSSPTGETTVFTEHSLTVLSEQKLDWLQSGGGLSTGSRSQEGTLVGVLATSQAPRASSCAEVRGPSFRNAPPPNDCPPVQIVRGVGSVAAGSIQATGPHCAQWTRDAVAYGGSEGSKPYCASQRRGTLWLLG